MKIVHQTVPQELWVVFHEHIIVMATRDAARAEQYMTESSGNTLALYKLRHATKEIVRHDVAEANVRAVDAGGSGS